MIEHAATDYVDAAGWADQLATCAEGALILEKWLIGEIYPNRSGTRAIHGSTYFATLDWCTKSGKQISEASPENATHLAVTVLCSTGESNAECRKLQGALVDKIKLLQRSPLSELPQASV